MEVILSVDQVAGFLAAAVLVTVAPGPDNLMVLSLGISRGPRHGMAFGLGCGLGCLSHTTLAALGISAAIAASPWAFLALQVCGGLYLMWLGFQAVRSSGSIRLNPEAAPAGSGWSLFAKGLLANAINPKVILFFLAFLPQFVDTARGGEGWQTAQLGVLFTVTAAALFALLGFFAGRVGRWLARSPRLGLWLDRGAGGIFILLGLRLLIAA